MNVSVENIEKQVHDEREREERTRSIAVWLLFTPTSLFNEIRDELAMLGSVVVIGIANTKFRSVRDSCRVSAT